VPLRTAIRLSQTRLRGEVWHAAAGVGAIAIVTAVYVGWLHFLNPTVASLSFLLIVLLTSATSSLRAAVAVSVLAVLAFNFFFLPPVGTLTIADPQNWVALFVFLVVSLVASNLSAVARTRTQEALGRRNELARLFDLSRDVLLMTDSREAIAILARSVARRFDFEFVAIALPRAGEWDVFAAGTWTTALDTRQLSEAFDAARATIEFDAYARTYAGHREMTVEGRAIRLVPLRVGTTPIGLLAATGRPVEAGTLDTLAGVVAIAIERAQFLEERRAGELTRQSEELKTALLASLGHDLRTPLTTIRVAASNIKASWLTADDRTEQADLILAEGERLTRLFQNILDMARIDAGAVAAEFRWAHPSEIIAAARDQVEHALQRHTVALDVEPDCPVKLDPRLTASAVAHLLENAAQYTPAGSTVDVKVRVTGEGLSIQVRDHGPGIAPADLPHLFDRFYRGDAAKTRVSGTGMGLSIARGLLAAERGRIWAEQCPDGGALFSIVVPAETKGPEPSSPEAA
jgi:two-component system, OmpR family, sensor histidine kinase KdpD